jgi:hypothetical protein
MFSRTRKGRVDHVCRLRPRTRAGNASDANLHHGLNTPELG